MGIGGVAWNAYWFLFRFVHELELTNDELAWKAPLASGSVRLADLVQVRPMLLGLGVQVIEYRNGRPLLVWASGQLKPFLERLKQGAPEVGVRLGWSVRSAAGASERLNSLDRAKQRRLLKLLVVVFVSSLGALFYGVADAADRSDVIRRRSVPVEGEILLFTNDLRGGREAVVRYRVGDRELMSETVARGFDARVGDRIPLRYDPERPTRVFEEDEEEPPGGELSLWTPLAFMTSGLSGVLAFRLWRRLRRATKRG
ncbi:MAG TPA: DUF3592 domain-containing protein [Acidimicrobiales bacterium]|nr:DUF3592 domain-containing protein [Acidimicrobiales bacterium]